MPVMGWVICIIFGMIILVVGVCLFDAFELTGKIVTGLVTVALILGLFLGCGWYFKNTANGQRMVIDEKSNFQNGIERTITVYTANGEVIATYSGKIDIEGNDGGYVLFDFDGKRYIYYNCFVESIADIS